MSYEEPSRPPLSARDRIRLGTPRKYKDVVLEEPVGRLRIAALSQTELEDMGDSIKPEAKPTLDPAKAIYTREEVEKLTAASGTSTNKGFMARVIAWGLVNDDGTKVYPDVEEGVREIGRLSKEDVGKLFEAFDELNLITASARDKLGKASGVTAGDKG